MEIVKFGFNLCKSKGRKNIDFDILRYVEKYHDVTPHVFKRYEEGKMPKYINYGMEKVMNEANRVVATTIIVMGWKNVSDRQKNSIISDIWGLDEEEYHIINCKRAMRNYMVGVSEETFSLLCCDIDEDELKYAYNVYIDENSCVEDIVYRLGATTDVRRKIFLAEKTADRVSLYVGKGGKVTFVRDGEKWVIDDVAYADKERTIQKNIVERLYDELNNNNN